MNISLQKKEMEVQTCFPFSELDVQVQADDRLCFLQSSEKCPNGDTIGDDEVR